MTRCPLFACIAALCICAGYDASACNLEQVTITRFQPEIDRWSDGSGQVVRLLGTVATTCNAWSSAELAIDEKDASGRLIASRLVWVERIPPGGMDFDLAGKIPFDPAVKSYEASIVRTR